MTTARNKVIDQVKWISTDWATTLWVEHFLNTRTTHFARLAIISLQHILDF